MDLASYPAPLEAKAGLGDGDCEKGTVTRARQSYGSLAARLPPGFLSSATHGN